MTIRLIDGRWEEEFDEALREDASELRIICPFIKEKTIQMLLNYQPNQLQVITRFNLGDFVDGVSDVAALRRLVVFDARVRGVKDLHAKLYIFGRKRAIITSCNLTEAALHRNHELGVVSTDGLFIEECLGKFDELWNDAGKDLVPAQAEDWDQTVRNYLQGSGPQPDREGLSDFGVDIGCVEALPVHAPNEITLKTQAFVKFLGSDKNRFDLSASTIEVIKWEGCHRAVCYPTRRTPVSVNDNDVIFLGRLTRDPNDIRVFGRAIGMAYRKGKDDASEAEIKKQGWRRDYSRYIRLHDAEFVDGPIGRGVSLHALMDELGADSFASTHRHKKEGVGNIDPRRAYNQQAQVMLTPHGFSWLNERLQDSFDTYGRVPGEFLDNLDWPDTSDPSPR